MSNVIYDYSGYTVIITGAARGLGRAHAEAFARAGATVVLCDFDPKVAAVADEISSAGGTCVPATCDVSNAEQVRRMVGDVIVRFGQIDVLINNAGVESLPTVAEMSEDDWDRVIDINLKGTFLCSKYVADHMVVRERGSIICTGSTSSVMGLSRQAHYCAAKHGIIGFARALAIELAPSQITVNTVCPGAIRTNMPGELAQGPNADWLASLPALAGSKNLFKPGTSLEAEEVTGAMMWLASDTARSVTGAVIMVDAGYTIK